MAVGKWVPRSGIQGGEAIVFSTALGRRKFFRRPIPQRAVRPHRVVVHSPGLDHLARISQIHEPVLVQAFVPELPVEAFDEHVLRRFASLDEVQRHLMLMGPLIHHAAGELRPVVHLDRGRRPSRYRTMGKHEMGSGRVVAHSEVIVGPSGPCGQMGARVGSLHGLS